MFVIVTNFFVQLFVENLLKVLKIQVFHILYFLDYCLFARVCTFRARARIVIIDCLPYYSGSPPRRGARRKGGADLIAPPLSLYMIMLWMPLVWCPLCWGNFSFARKGLVSSVCVKLSRLVFFNLFVCVLLSCLVNALFGCFTSLFCCVLGCFSSSCKSCA